MLKLKEKFALIDGVGWHEGVGLVKFSVSYKMGVLLSALPTCLIRDKNELKTTRSFAICKIITLPYKSYVCDLILQSNPSIVQVFSILLLQENKGIGKSLGLLFLQGIPHTKVMSQKYNIGISCCYLLGSLGNLCESLGSKHTLIYK